MISVVVSSFFIDEEKPSLLNRCINSLVGADEILALATCPKSPLGFCDAWNRIASLSKGDFIVFAGDNTYQTAGDLRDLCIPNTVTFPSVPQNTEFMACVFCLPRDIYEESGLYDMDFNDGVHYMDEDLFRRLRKKYSFKTVGSVVFEHKYGGRTVNKIPNFNELVSKNRDLLDKKWNDQK